MGAASIVQGGIGRLRLEPGVQRGCDNRTWINQNIIN